MSYDPGATAVSDPGTETVALDLLAVAVRRHVSRSLIVGAQRPTVEAIVDHTADSLVAALNAFVLTEHAGPMATDWLRVELPLRPRWMPRWLWRRVPCRPAVFELRVRPLWVYPQATFKVPDGRLGAAVMMAQRQPSTRVADWRRS